MLSTTNMIKDYKDNKKRFLFYLRKLEQKELYYIYKGLDEYEKEMLYKELKKETLLSLIDIMLHRLTFNQNVLNVAPELKYKGKYPEKHKKNISKIAEQLDINEGC